VACSQCNKLSAAAVNNASGLTNKTPTGCRVKLAKAASMSRLALAGKISTCCPIDTAAARVFVTRASVIGLLGLTSIAERTVELLGNKVAPLVDKALA